MNENDIKIFRKLLNEALTNYFRLETIRVVKNKIVVCGRLPITMPPASLRDNRIFQDLKLFDREVLGFETFAHLREYQFGEPIGIVLKIEELENLK